MSEARGPGGPLSGVRIIEFAGLGAAPYGVMLLADLGADVIRVDRPGAGSDPSTLAHVGVWRGRRSIVIDLKHPEGRDVIRRLVADADVLVEGFRPGTMERLGLGPDELTASNPRLVYARMTGWGQDGPLARTAGHDLNYAALSGALHTVGPADRPPPPVANYLADNGGGMLLSVGVLAALVERERSGLGQVVDAAMVDAAASLTTFVRGLSALGAWSEERGENLLDGGAPFYATYRCSDDRFVAVGAIEPQFFRALIDGLGLPEETAALQNDRARWGELRRALEERIATEPRDVWAARFANSDGCVTPVLTLAEAGDHPHHVARAAFDVPLAGPLPAGIDGAPMPSPAPRLSRTPGHVARPAPAPGSHTRAILAEVGLSASSADYLVERGVVSDS